MFLTRGEMNEIIHKKTARPGTHRCYFPLLKLICTLAKLAYRQLAKISKPAQVKPHELRAQLWLVSAK